MSDDTATKTCPDCAETVRAAAAACRFCGYRFDESSGSVPRTAAGLFSLLRRPAHTMTTSSLLARWSVPDGDDTDTSEVWFGTIEDTKGYVVVTAERFLFLADATTARPRRVAHQRRLTDLVGARRRRHGMRHEVEIEWAGEDAMVVTYLSRGDAARLESALAAILAG